MKLPRIDRIQTRLDRLSRASRFGSIAFIPLILALGGCGEDQMGGPRVEVVPITGKVLVDGEPQANVAVLFLRESDKGVDFPVPEPEGITDENGVITVGTYYKDDGGAPGTYKLCFLWLTMNNFTGEMSGDKFRGKYDNKAQSEITVTIPAEFEGDAHDIGTIELSTM